MDQAHAGSGVMTRARSHGGNRAGWLAWSGVGLSGVLTDVEFAAKKKQVLGI